MKDKETTYLAGRMKLQVEVTGTEERRMKKEMRREGKGRAEK